MSQLPRQACGVWQSLMRANVQHRLLAALVRRSNGTRKRSTWRSGVQHTALPVWESVLYVYWGAAVWAHAAWH